MYVIIFLSDFLREKTAPITHGVKMQETDNNDDLKKWAEKLKDERKYDKPIKVFLWIFGILSIAMIGRPA